MRAVVTCNFCSIMRFFRCAPAPMAGSSVLGFGIASLERCFIQVPLHTQHRLHLFCSACRLAARERLPAEEMENMASPLIAKYQPKQTTTSSHKSNLAEIGRAHV